MTEQKRSSCSHACATAQQPMCTVASRQRALVWQTVQQHAKQQYTVLAPFDCDQPQTLSPAIQQHGRGLVYVRLQHADATSL